jgi:hypothetical protein
VLAVGKVARADSSLKDDSLAPEIKACGERWMSSYSHTCNNHLLVTNIERVVEIVRGWCSRGGEIWLEKRRTARAKLWR